MQVQITNEQEKEKVLLEIRDARTKLEQLEMETNSFEEELAKLNKQLDIIKKQLAEKKSTTRDTRKNLETLIKSRRDAIADYEISKV